MTLPPSTTFGPAPGPVWHSASGLPSLETLVAYFGAMGYALETMHGEPGAEQGDGGWRLYRPTSGKAFKIFHSLAGLWSWWRQMAAVLIMDDSRFRLALALYRSASDVERADMRDWALEAGHNRHRWTTEEPIGRWRRYTAEGLPPYWPAQARDIELACMTPGEHWSTRFLRFADEFDHALTRSALERSLPDAEASLASKRL